MDNHFSSGYNLPYNPTGQPQPNPLTSFGNLSSQNHQQQQDSPSHTTLPPLQGQNGGYGYNNMPYPAHANSQQQNNTAPHTPVSSSVNGFSHLSPTNAPPVGSMLPPSTYPQPYPPLMQYATSSGSSLPPTSASMGLPTIRPMPPGGVGGPMSGLPSLSTGGMGQQPSFMQNEEAPTHVVGSQGRRGILPSAPGRPNPPPQGSAGAAKSMIPQKDADGKFPCPHCNKTYLHAKHLKRHLLRHTGDRPYMCHLCKDTFSRSDILKRHFAKCSIRRGNPTGANHLAHQRRNTNPTNRLSMTQQDGPIGLAGLQEVSGGNNYADGMTASPTVNGEMSGRSSRANSIISPAGMSNRNSIAGLGILSSNANQQNEQMGSSGGYQPGMPAYSGPNSTNSGSMHSNYAFNSNPQMGAFNSQSQMPFLGHPSSRFGNSHEHSPHTNGDGGGGINEWNRMFNQGGQDGFIQPANASSQQVSNIKTESEQKSNYTTNDMSNDSFLGSLYSHPSALESEYGENDQGMLGFPNWSVDDPLQAKVDSLFQFCFPRGVEAVRGDAGAQIVKECLTVDNVKHFAEHYTSFHGHWPILHIPTFKITDANNGLVLAIICIGAIYSPRMNVGQTRQMMDFVHDTIITNSSIYNRTMNGQTAGLGTHKWEVDEMQALIILQCMLTWHGESHQRQTARNELPGVVRTARGMGMFQTVPPGHYAHSVLHASQENSQVDMNSWQWHSWLEQELRNRALYQLFLMDAAFVIYFNSALLINPADIRLCLPADDAAWDAKDWQSCASALGVFGPQAQSRNVTGTRRFKQPGMREALRSLKDNNVQFQQNATNAYSKFILIHALIVLIIACQKAILLQTDLPFSPYNHSSSTPATPLSQHDWLEQRSGSGNSSGRVTPTDGIGPGVQNMAGQLEKKKLGFALERWKRTWDSDMDLQYPPSQTQRRRFGFSRDGVHFFFLGRSFLQSQRASDWTTPPDVRFGQVMSLLKRIKGVVVGDIENKGQDIGSVGDIDDQYGLDNLTLDMKLLFKPYNSQIDSPVASVQTSL